MSKCIKVGSTDTLGIWESGRGDARSRALVLSCGSVNGDPVQPTVSQCDCGFLFLMKIPTGVYALEDQPKTPSKVGRVLCAPDGRIDFEYDINPLLNIIAKYISPELPMSCYFKTKFKTTLKTNCGPFWRARSVQALGPPWSREPTTTQTSS